MITDTTAKLNRLNETFWFRLPVVFRRFFPSFSMILTDGIYTSAWPQAGGAAPLLAGFVGFMAGATFLDTDPTKLPIYSSSLLVMGVLVAVSSLGAALGVWLFLGYVLGDLLVFRLLRAFGTDAQLGRHGMADVGYLAVLYGLLAVLLVSVPFVSHRLRQLALFLPGEIWNLLLASCRKRGKKLPGFFLAVEKAAANAKPGFKKWGRFPFDMALHIVFTGLLIYFWAQTTLLLLRSAYIWVASPDQNLGIDIAQITLLQQGYGPLMKVGATVGGIRIALEYMAAGRSAFMKRVRALRGAMRGIRTRQNGAGAWLGEGVRIAVITLLLYGILQQPPAALGTATVLLALAVVRRVALPRWASWCNTVTAIPLLVRLAAVVGGSYLVGYYGVMPGVIAGRFPSFKPLLVQLLIWLALATALFPEKRQADNPAAPAQAGEGSKG